MDEEDQGLAPPAGWFGERYEIIKPLRQGAMGQVFLAKQTDLGRRVVLKALPAEFGADAKLSQRFRLEMKVMSVLEHPNTVRLYDFGTTTTGEYYIAMEYIDGVDVQTEVAESGRMHPSRIVRLGLQVARALHAAHAEGVIHRDLKPENIMIRDLYGEKDVAKVLDFGIAKYEPGGEAATDEGLATEGRRPRLTQRGMVVGTPQYVSPEQAVADPIDARSDIYSLGCVLYFAACGQPPFDHENIMTVLYHHIHTVPPSPASLVGLPQALSDVIMMCLAKEPEDRVQTAAEVAQALLKARQSFGSTTPVGGVNTLPSAAPVAEAAGVASGYAQTAVLGIEAVIPLSKQDLARERRTNPSDETVVTGGPGPGYDVAFGEPDSAAQEAVRQDRLQSRAAASRHPLARPTLLRADVSARRGKSKVGMIVGLVFGVVAIAAVAMVMTSKVGTEADGPAGQQSVPAPLQPVVERCNQGQSVACLDAAKAFRLGAGVKSDLEAAAMYATAAVQDFTSRCESGGAYFCFALGNLYSADAAVPLDLTRASEFYGRACKLGYEDACALK